MARFFTTSALLLFSFCYLALPAQAQQRPNIIYILADDMGYGDVTALNPDCKIKTPQLDQLARGGMIFTDAHSSSSVCTPTRYGILTGRYNWRSRLQNGVCWGFSRRLIEPKRTTVGSLLQAHGYHTAAVGKWHLGMDWPLKKGGFADDGDRWSPQYRGGWDVDYSKPIQNGPNTLGFDYFFGISASLDMPPYVFIRNDKPQVSKLVEKAFQRKGPADVDFEAIDVLPRITEEVVSYIGRRAEAAKAGKPFFVYFPLNAPHTPILPTAAWKGKSGLNAYGDFVMQVDDTVGQVMKALDKHGLAENTLLIFTADNGCSPQAKFDQLHAKGHHPSYQFRGHKADIFEGGHRVPFIARWPSKIKSQSRSDQLICLTDLMATCGELVQSKLPADAGVDSVSILPALLGNDTKPLREAVVHHSIRGAFSIRKGDWKLELCPGSGGWSAPRPGRGNLAKLPAYQLYNLKENIGETENLQAKHPQVIKELTTLLQSYVDRGRSTPGVSQANHGPINIYQAGREAQGKKP
ncbi:MAG: arylsulfatase [Pirellulaceae bacterium]|nr:arylsulfatase [Pirellulaceae bacterium]